MLSIAFAGCGSGGGTTTASTSSSDAAALQAVRSAPDASARVRTRQFQLHSTDTTFPDVTGYEDLQRGGVDVTLTPVGETNRRLVLIGRAAYVVLAAKQRAELRGRPRWGKIALDRLRGNRYVRSTELVPAFPLMVLAFLRGVSTSRPTGTERVAGVGTRRYHVRGDMRRAIARLTAAERVRFGSIVRGFVRRTSGTGFSGDVWLDGRGRVVREHLGSGDTELTLSLFGFNEGRGVRPPSARQTADITAALAASGLASP